MALLPTEQKQEPQQVPGLTALTGQLVNAAQLPQDAKPMDAVPTNVPTLPPPPAPGTFDANNNLINSQVTGGQTTATAPQTTTTATAPQTTNFGTGAITAGASPQSDPSFQKYTQGFDSALSNISNGPNRTQLALQTLQDFDIAGQPQLAADFRKVGQSAAKFGRLGAGMTTNDLTGLQGTYDRNKMLLKNELARSVAEGDINDRYRTADVYSNARNQQYGFGNTDRGYNTGVDQYNQGALFDRQRAGNDAQSQYEDRLFSQRRAGNQDLADYQDRLFGQQGQLRNELRGERDYQYGLSRNATDDAVRQRMLEDQLLNSAFGRSESRLNAGQQGNPTDLLNSFGSQAGAEAGDLYNAAGGLFQNWGSQSGGSSSGSSGNPYLDFAMNLIRNRGTSGGSGGLLNPGDPGYDPRIDG